MFPKSLVPEKYKHIEKICLIFGIIFLIILFILMEKDVAVLLTLLGAMVGYFFRNGRPR